MKRVDAGRVADAVAPLEAACRIDPNYAPAHVYLGWAYYLQQKFAEAAAEYQIALRTEPSANTHYCLGLALEAEKDAAGAVAEYEAALRIDPKYEAASARLTALR